jgi:NAD(P)-dependent dehydrogenase (short-subunit alcohol dehydrogenase family)
MRLKDKRILVTGSTTGIGKAIARRCHEEGARVIIHGLEEDLARETSEELGGAPVHLCDLSDPATPAQLIEFSVTQLGGLDGLVNNAGVVTRAQPAEMSLEMWDWTYAINVRAPFLLIQAALPELARSHGRVLNIGSINAHGGESYFAAYASSKGALQTLTRNLGDTLHRDYGVVVNQINPGWVLTENESARKQEDGLPKDWPTKVPKIFAPSGRILKPEEIAAGALYWLEDDSGPVSGCVVELEQFPAHGRNPDKVNL